MKLRLRIKRRLLLALGRCPRCGSRRCEQERSVRLDILEFFED